MPPVWAALAENQDCVADAGAGRPGGHLKMMRVMRGLDIVAHGVLP